MKFVGRCRLIASPGQAPARFETIFSQKFAVADFSPVNRTILHGSLSATKFGSFIRFPYLRFLLSYVDRCPNGVIYHPKNIRVSKNSRRLKKEVLWDWDHRYLWTGKLFLYGSMTPFANDEIGFAIPLPNFSSLGYLTCSGTMIRHFAPSLEVLVSLMVDNFWTSRFYNFLESDFPLKDGRSVRNFYEFVENHDAIFPQLFPIENMKLVDWE